MNDFTLISTSYNKKHQFTFRVIFTEKQNIATNKTNLSFKLQMEYTSGSGTAWAEYGSKLRYTLKINGESFSGNIPDYYEGDYKNTKKTLVILSNKSLSNAITHNTNGTKSISVSMEIIDNTPVEYVPYNASKTQTLSLTSIPRTSSFTISSTSINVEDSVKFIITRNATSFTHKISWSVVYNNTTTQIKTHNLGTTINTNLTVPLEFYDFFIKNKIKEISTTITCTTYSGTTKIGAATKTATVKMSAVKCIPIITNITLDENSVNFLGTFNQNSVIEKKEGQAPKITISYDFPSANYLARIKAVVSGFSTEVIKEISSFEEKIKIVDPTGFFSSVEKTLKDFSNYEFYNNLQGEITNIVKNYIVQTISETVDDETITSTVYKITEFNCDILLNNYLPYLMTNDQVNKIYYRYGIYTSAQDLGLSNIYEAEISNNSFSVLKNSNLEEEDIAITLDKLTTPFNVVIKLWDDKSTENQAIEIKKTIIIQPIFDWSEEDFQFNVPVKVEGVSLFYKPGDKIEFANQDEFWSGVITSSKTQLIFSIPLDKPAFVNGATIENGWITPRIGEGGYLCFNGQGETQFNIDSDNVKEKYIRVKNNKSVRVSVTANSAFQKYDSGNRQVSNIVNNQCVSVGSNVPDNASKFTIVFN